MASVPPALQIGAKFLRDIWLAFAERTYADEPLDHFTFDFTDNGDLRLTLQLNPFRSLSRVGRFTEVPASFPERTPGYPSTRQDARAMLEPEERQQCARSAFLSRKTCVAALALHGFVQEIIDGIDSVRACHFRHNDPPLIVVEAGVNPGGPIGRNHSILILSTKDGKEYALDITGAQYGHAEVVEFWDVYQKRYVESTISLVEPDGRVSIDSGHSESAEFERYYVAWLVDGLQKGLKDISRVREGGLNAWRKVVEEGHGLMRRDLMEHCMDFLDKRLQELEPNYT